MNLVSGRHARGGGLPSIPREVLVEGRYPGRVVRLTSLLIVAALAVTACGRSGNDDSPSATATASVPAPIETVGFATISGEAAAEMIAAGPDDLVVLDVRTPEEFAEGHLDGAVLVDFYSPDFADQLAALDPDVPYVVYCRSGNRSGQTLPMMESLGFSSASDVDGGIVAWESAGLPIIVN